MLEQNRLSVQDEHKVTALGLTHLKTGLNKIQNSLSLQRHQTELRNIYNTSYPVNYSSFEFVIQLVIKEFLDQMDDKTATCSC